MKDELDQTAKLFYEVEVRGKWEQVDLETKEHWRLQAKQFYAALRAPVPLHLARPSAA